MRRLFLGWWLVSSWMTATFCVGVDGSQNRTLRTRLTVGWKDCSKCREYDYSNVDQDWNALLTQMKSSLATTELYHQLYHSLPITASPLLTVLVNPTTMYTTTGTSTTVPSCQIEEDWNKIEFPPDTVHPYATAALPKEEPFYQHPFNDDDDDDDGTVWIVYGNMQMDSSLDEWWKECIDNFPAKKIMFRPIDTSTSSSKTRLNGYGVRLDLRNIEYRSHYVDDDSTQKEEGHTIVLPTNTTYLSHQLLQHLSLSKKDHGDVLSELETISWNFPNYAFQLSQQPTSTGNTENNMAIPPLGLYVNGKQVLFPKSDSSFNVFSLLHDFSTLSTKHDQSYSNFQSHFHPSSHSTFSTLLLSNTLSKPNNNNNNDDNTNQQTSNSYNPIRVDVGRGNRHVIWYINNHEQSKQRQEFDISEEQWMWILQMGAPLSIPQNLYTVLFIIDPLSTTDKQSLASVFSQLQQLLSNQFSIRVGFIFYTKDVEKEEAVLAVQAVAMRIVDQYGYLAGLSFLLRFLFTTSQTNVVNERYILDAYANFFAQTNIPYDYDEMRQYLQKQKLLQASHQGRIHYEKVKQFCVSRNLQPGMIFFNGIPLTPQEGLISILQEETLNLFHNRHVFFPSSQQKSSRKTVYASLLSSPNRVFPTYHPILQQSSTTREYQLSWSTHPFVYQTKKNPVIEDKQTKNVPHYLLEAVIDLSTMEGFQLLQSIIPLCSEYTANNDVTIGLACRLVPSNIPTIQHPLAPILFTSYIQHDKDNYWTKLLQPVLSLCIQQLTCTTLSSFPVPIDNNHPTYKEWMKIQPTLETATNQNAKLLDKNNYIMINGCVYEPSNGMLQKADLDILFSLDQETALDIWNHFSWEDISTNAYDALGRAIAWLCREFTKANENSNAPVVDLHQFTTSYSVNFPDRVYSYHLDDQEEISKKIQITAILDPLSEMTQRVVSLLRLLKDELHLPLRVVFVPETYEKEDTIIPLTSYYRFVMTEEEAYFDQLPTNHILTLRMDVPEQWDVQQTLSIQDTDNLDCNSHHCGDISHNDGDEKDKNSYHTDIEYGLKSLLFFGQCYDVTAGTPPNGLSLTLTNAISSMVSSSSSQEILVDGSVHSVDDNNDTIQYHSDTVVMKTVGYWQLQANPGIWTLKIAPESRGAEIYNMVEGNINGKTGKIELAGNDDGSEYPQQTKTLIMRDFVNHGELLLVKRKPGFERAELFPAQPFNQQQEVNSDDDDDDVVHVFSLATGHLYERFLKIMMLSVTKRTSTRVKFWLFENYLSPSFKASAMDMAKRIGCEVSFVTYKWPNWLRGQSVKQRIIWGYKILFLDVLFPLHVKKIIYVDADQVVRGDLKELWDMDLHGAPYGYTPMCSSREETLGYQFWRTGFWKSHLRDKPYHISALYVVDLQRFRRDLVGDKLRSYYQQLSADPHSLSNLDQDLPNYAQFDVPIFSLPQEWLWCESWCSDETKSQAKTIDLCNNPEHKEPKVSMAKRIISGPLFQESWIELDAEVDNYERLYFDSIQQ